MGGAEFAVIAVGLHEPPHQVQIHGLRRGVSRGLLLRGREHARDPPPEAARTEANRVRGCASQVWLATEVNGAPAGVPSGATLRRGCWGHSSLVWPAVHQNRSSCRFALQ
jgi:hypothetical protein